MGWLPLVALAALSFVALWRFARPPRATLELIGAALFLAIAGYAWQGRPSLAGKPAETREGKPGLETGFAAERRAFLGRFGADAQVLDTADSFIAQGLPDYAVGIVNGAIERRPKSPDLWLGLANALTVYADGGVTPAARYAFDRAAALAPQSPAPRYFMGLAYAQSGDLAQGLAIWRTLLAATPADAPWRPLVAEKIQIADGMAQMR